MNKIELLNQGFKHFAQKEYENAEKSFQKALEIDDSFELALNALAETYNRMGQLEKAAEILKKMIGINPNDPVNHTALSRIYVQMGKIKEAEDEMALSNYLARNK